MCTGCTYFTLWCCVNECKAGGASQYSGLVWHCVQVGHWVQERVVIGMFVLCILYCTCWWVLEWVLTAFVNYSYPWKGQPIDRVLMEEVRKRYSSLCGVESHIPVSLIVIWPVVMYWYLRTYICTYICRNRVFHHTVCLILYNICLEVSKMERA